MKNFVILFTEIIFILLMVFGIFPREASLFITGLLIFYFIFSPLEDSLWVFIASIPLFVALPINENFDTLANWRILVVILFLVWFFKQWSHLAIRWPDTFGHRMAKWEYLSLIFLGISFLSLFVAEDVWVGLKKIIFLVNAFLIYIVIRNLAIKNKEVIPKIFSAIKVAIGIVLGVGFFQLLMVFFVNLHQFWYLWTYNVTDVFYGKALSYLVAYSNTWFSYYSYQLPTLRMFSVFPDSHSFAFFCILSLSFIVSLVFLKTGEKKIKTILLYLLLVLGFLAIIFSGSRGAWVSALGVLLVVIFFIPKLYSKYKKQVQMVLASLVLFFVLFPVASAILFLPQYIQLGNEAMMGFSFFERSRSIFNLNELSVKSRLEIWRRTFDSMVIHPILGVGIGNYPLVLNEKLSTAKKGSSAHNLYLDFAAEIGIFGLLVLLAVFWYIVKDVWHIFTRAKESFLQVWTGFFLLALIWILGYSLFDVVLLNDKVLLFFVINLGILYGTKSTISLDKSSHLER